MTPRTPRDGSPMRCQAALHGARWLDLTFESAGRVAKLVLAGHEPDALSGRGGGAEEADEDHENGEGASHERQGESILITFSCSTSTR